MPPSPRSSHRPTILLLSLATLVSPGHGRAVEPPKIVTEPVVLGQETLVWPREGGDDTMPQRPFDFPDLTGRANVLDDWHMQTDPKGWDLLVSTSGNFHRFLNAFLRQVYLPANPRVAAGQWGYSTSPPIAIEQIARGGRLAFGNLEIRGVPMVVMGPKDIMDGVVANGWNDGAPAKILSNHGNVLLVRAGNPRSIRDIFDLGRDDVRVVTSNPRTEPGSFGNYASTVFHVAFRQAEAETDDPTTAARAATELFHRVFNPTDNATRRQWVAGDRIHHRDVPQALADDDADVGLFFYHLARTAIEAHPGRFEIVPLGGTADDPRPVLGNRVATMQAIRIAGDWTPEQTRNRDRWFHAITDPAANAALLERYWVRPPVATGNNQPPLP